MIPVSTNGNMKQKRGPVDVNTKLRTNDMKAHVMELDPDLFDGEGTIKDAMVNLDINPSITPIVQPPRKVP